MHQSAILRNQNCIHTVFLTVPVKTVKRSLKSTPERQKGFSKANTNRDVDHCKKAYRGCALEELLMYST